MGDFFVAAAWEIGTHPPERMINETEPKVMRVHHHEAGSGRGPPAGHLQRKARWISMAPSTTQKQRGKP